jgi:hypothetical protein
VICIVAQTDLAVSMKYAKKMKYQEEFMKFGFTSVVSNGDEWPQWVCDML